MRYQETQGGKKDAREFTSRYVDIFAQQRLLDKLSISIIINKASKQWLEFVSFHDRL